MHMRTTNFIQLLMLAGSLFFYSCESKEQPVDHPAPLPDSIFDKITELDNAQLTLSGDLSHLIEEVGLDENNKEKFFPAELKITSGTETIELPLRIAKRGVTRKSICDFPPIKFKFKADTLVNRGYSKFNTYKFVTHCIEGGDQLTIAEFLAYKIYNHITDKSFRVKLVEIKYEDQSERIVENIKDKAYMGFLIEEDQELAYRLNAELYEGEIKAIDRKQYALMVVFQYMIGNTDWNLTGGHNIKWIKQSAVPSPTPLPYDFDFSGLVNAPHAAPHPQMPIKSVRERFLQWRGKTKDELNEIAAQLSQDKDEILNIVANEPHLSDVKKEEITEYLNEFFIQFLEKGSI